MPRLIATREVRYSGVTHKPGEEFEASEKDARILKGIGKAADPEKRETVPPRRALRTTALAEDAGEDAGEPARRRYRRRDLTAED